MGPPSGELYEIEAGRNRPPRRIPSVPGDFLLSHRELAIAEHSQPPASHVVDRQIDRPGPWQVEAHQRTPAERVRHWRPEAKSVFALRVLRHAGHALAIHLLGDPRVLEQLRPGLTTEDGARASPGRASPEEGTQEPRPSVRRTGARYPSGPAQG
jgi:hypothetical protein